MTEYRLTKKGKEEARKIRNHYEARASALEKICTNLTFIEADNSGRINWQDIDMTPYTFAQNFLIVSGGFSWSDQYTGFIPDEEISEKILEEGHKEIFDPIKQIESRKKGIVLGSAVGFLKLKYLRNEEDNSGGYLFYLSDSHLKNLSRLGIDYHLVEK